MTPNARFRVGGERAVLAAELLHVVRRVLQLVRLKVALPVGRVGAGVAFESAATVALGMLQIVAL